MIFGERGFGCPIAEDLPDRLVREEVCQIVWFAGEGEGEWLALMTDISKRIQSLEDESKTVKSQITEAKLRIFEGSNKRYLE